MGALADNYSALQGIVIRGGRIGPPAWAVGAAADTFSPVPSAPTFRAAATAVLPSITYLGTDPVGAIINAYGDPVFDAANNRLIFRNGGHGDGTINGFLAQDLTSLAITMISAPTPPSKYPPLYASPATNQIRSLIYPSGAGDGQFFWPDLTDARDTQYNTKLAPAASHTYRAIAVRRGKVHIFYSQYLEYDMASDTWADSRGFSLGPQLFAISSRYNNLPLQQGTVAIYDDVTDRFFVTLVAGDSGGGSRTSMMVIRPDSTGAAQPVIEAVYDTNNTTYGLIDSSVDVQKIGRKFYLFTKVAIGYAAPQNMNQGFIFDMDTHAMQKFTLIGDIAGYTYPGLSATQETIPSFVVGNLIHRWNYDAPFRDKIYSVNIVPESGTGSIADPFMLRQTARTIGGTIPSAVSFVYSRLLYVPAAGCAMVYPNADSVPFRLKLT